MIDVETAYVPFDNTGFVRWNPDTFTIDGEVAPPDRIALSAEESADLQVQRGYGHALRDGKLYQPYYFAGADFLSYAKLSQISVIDTQTDAVADVLDAPLPHLHIVSEDGAGNLYFSNGQGSIAGAVIDPKQPRNGFVRLAAGDDQLDEVVYFKDITEGREGGNFFAINERLALFNVYHAERDELGDPPDPQKISRSASFHLWTYDLERGEAKLMEGIDFSGGQIVAFPIAGRLWLAIPAGDYSQTAVYEVLPDGSAEKRFDVEGWAYKMFKVR